MSKEILLLMHFLAKNGFSDTENRDSEQLDYSLFLHILCFILQFFNSYIKRITMCNKYLLAWQCCQTLAILSWVDLNVPFVTLSSICCFFLCKKRKNVYENVEGNMLTITANYNFANRAQYIKRLLPKYSFEHRSWSSVILSWLNYPCWYQRAGVYHSDQNGRFPLQYLCHLPHLHLLALLPRLHQ